MKKSELIVKLEDMIKRHRECCDNRTLAELVVDEVVEAGMKPPSYQIWPRSKGIGGAVASTRVDNQWEPENE